jgi:hypothetical protein
MKGQVGLEQFEERYAEDKRDIGGLVHGQEIYRALSDDAIHVAEQETGPRFSLCTVGNRTILFGKHGAGPHEIRVARDFRRSMPAARRTRSTSIFPATFTFSLHLPVGCVTVTIFMLIFHHTGGRKSSKKSS